MRSDAVNLDETIRIDGGMRTTTDMPPPVSSAPSATTAACNLGEMPLSTAATNGTRSRLNPESSLRAADILRTQLQQQRCHDQHPHLENVQPQLPRRQPISNRHSNLDTESVCSVFTTTTAAASALDGIPGMKAHVHVGGLTDDTLQHCYDALSVIDPDERKGWEQAQLRCAPQVLQQESCPCYFMVACQNNPWDAAGRLCTYWRERIDLFEEKAFEGLTAGSDEAPPTGLTPEDVEILETGCVHLMPNDRQGRSVYLADLSRIKPHMYANVKGRLRVLWYVLHKSYTSGEPQAHRLVTLCLCTPPPGTGFDWSYASGCMKIPTTLPIHAETIHLLTLPALTGTGRMLQAITTTAINMIGNFFQHLVKVHHGAKIESDCMGDPTGDGAAGGPDINPQERLLQQLRQYGLSKRGLPTCAGGNVPREAFAGWLKRQRRIEHQMFWSAAQRAQRKRAMNRVHSRQKRLRRHQEHQDLQQHAHDLRVANHRARQVQGELELLLSKAHEMIRNLFESGSLDMAVGPASLPLDYGITSDPILSQSSAGTAPVPDSISQMLAALEPDPIAPSCIPQTPNMGGMIPGLPVGASMAAVATQHANHDSFQQIIPIPVSSHEPHRDTLDPSSLSSFNFVAPPPAKCSSADLPTKSDLLPPPVAATYGASTAAQQHLYMSQLFLTSQDQSRGNSSGGGGGGGNVLNFMTTIQVNQQPPMHVTNCIFTSDGSAAPTPVPTASTNSIPSTTQNTFAMPAPVSSSYQPQAPFDQFSTASMDDPISNPSTRIRINHPLVSDSLDRAFNYQQQLLLQHPSHPRATVDETWKTTVASTMTSGALSLTRWLDEPLDAFHDAEEDVVDFDDTPLDSVLGWNRLD